MGLFKKIKEKKEAKERIPSFHEQEYINSLRLYDEAHADVQYQIDLTRFYDLLNEIREMYSVINSIDSFSNDSGDRLVAKCKQATNLEFAIRKKREYYEDTRFEISEPLKTLAMVCEKRGDYQGAAEACIIAIKNGFTADGTKSGMRGRLARMIKKGNLPLTDDIKQLLNLQ